ncbi:Two-component transcriptional response regulator, LuxR family [hydrothermal vent metagenome]|uniref:Two-component transcriptional response regulator, LuxR family n=1 Tax=hydrothermal vent metagenome TaxID=652676 RepID=A0A3B0TVZ3_9ZZZZ
MKILIIEDEFELLIAISNYLIKENYICELASNFITADEKLAIYEYDIILLDITLPDGNGLGLIKTIKKYNSNAGVIIISAKNSLDDKINGLDLGADDYLTKPFHLSELNSRIKAVIRRRRFEGNNILKFNEISVNEDSKSVIVNEIEITLTKKEYDLLLYFLINRNRVLTKEAIAEHLWGDNIDSTDNFDFIYTHLNNLRRKIKEAGGKDYVKMLYGMGYKFTGE